MKINDIRKNFQNITFSNYKKAHVHKELYNSIYYEKKDESLYWTCELLCSGLVLDIWNIYIQYICKHIHIHNPKLIIYVVKKFNEFKVIANKLNDLDLRNSEEIRNIFFTITTIIGECKKDTMLDSPKFKLNFEISNNLKAPNVEYIQPFFKPGDPKECFIALNELTYHLKESKNKMDIFYWIDWLIEFELTLLKNKRHIVCVQRDFAPNKNIVWILWEILFSFKYNSILERIIESLFELFKIKYTHASNKKKKCLLHVSVMYIINSINYEKPLIENSSTSNLKILNEKIILIFERIKKNEIVS
jgi:hypothetical protein